MKIRTLLALSPAFALALGTTLNARTVETLTFEGLQDEEPINNFYNGGTGGMGSSGGPNYGIAFTSDSLALISKDAGGTGNFSSMYLPSGHTIGFFLSGAGDTMNVAAGFTTGFSFYYTSPYYVGTVNVYSGLNGTGTLLATLTLPETNPNIGSYAYDDWQPSGVSFAGTAESAIFTGVANQVGFDNITLGSSTPTPSAPDGGATASLLGLALLGLAGLRRKLS